MSEGVQFVSNNGYVTIDSRYFNMVLVSHGTVSGEALVDIPTPPECVVAIRPSVPAFSSPVSVGDGMVTRVRVAPHHETSAGGTVDIPISVEYFVFGPPTRVTPAGDYGVQICRPDGVAVYDSRLKYMIVVRVAPPAGPYPEQRPDSEYNAGYGSFQIHISHLVAGSHYRTESYNGRKLAAIIMSTRYFRMVTWPFGPPGSGASGQDFEVDSEMECVMAADNDLRVYDVHNSQYMYDVPVSVDAPPPLDRKGSGTVIVDVTGI